MKRTKQIAPRLASGESRQRIYNQLPPHIKLGLKLRAAREGKSMNWMMEKSIIRAFDLERPEYVRPTLKVVPKRRQG